MAKYAIWNKQDSVITPVGGVYTAEQWMQRYPVAALDSVTVVCGAGEINGSYFGTLGNMVETYTKMGCDFSACTTDQEKLDAIEAFDDEKAAEAAAAAENTVSNDDLTASSLASIAASLEFQNMMTLEDVEVQ